MAQADQTIGVCLYKLDAREEAVLKRVVTFNGAQGRHYALTDLQSAQLVVVSDETEVDLALMQPQGALLIRIANPDNEQPYDVLMQRPLLVTRVMRSLDDARKLWLDTAAGAMSIAPAVVQSKVAELVSIEPTSEPTPVVDNLSHAVDTAPAQTDIPTTEVLHPKVQLSEPAAASSDSVEALLEPVREKLPEQTEAPAAEIVVPDEVQTAQPLSEPPTEEAANYHHRALVVDDSAAIRKQLEIELRAAGIASDFAETGEEALQKVASHTYDLVFLDIIMPGIDGYETCRQMRLRREMKKTPIIMLSAKTSPLDEVQGVIAGASTYLTKPVKSDQLQKTLKRVAMWLDNFQQARS